MEAENQNNKGELKEVEVKIKRGRGRPKKGEKVEKEPKAKVGRPRKYEFGYDEARGRKKLVERGRYYELIEIEKKYKALLEDLNALTT
jgi:hypothetical protein